MIRLRITLLDKPGALSELTRLIAEHRVNIVDTLYNLQADPAETTDVYPARPEMGRALDARLAAIADEISQGAKKPKKGGTGAN